MDNLIQDLRYGFRMLWRSPGFSVIAILALALGIGVNSVIFSVVNAVLLRPLPYPKSEAITSILAKDPETGKLYGAYSYPNFQDVRDQNHVFDQVAAFQGMTAFMRGESEPERLRGVAVSADIFPLLGVNPVLGRTFTPEEERSGSQSLVVLGYEFWQRRFNGDPKIVGQQLVLDNITRTVLGVMPKRYKLPAGSERTDFLVPLEPELPPGPKAARGAVWLGVLGRLKDGVSLDQAQAEMLTLSNRLAAQYPDSNTGFEIGLLSAQERIVGKLRPALLVLLGAVAFVLLIACANVANLLLARATVRRKEIAIRTAIGASRLRVMRQLLTESILLSLLGGGLGLLIAAWGIDLLVSLSPKDLPRIGEIGLDRYVMLFTFGLATVTGIIFGLAPAVQASNPDLNETLKDGARGLSGGLHRNRVRSLLVISEIAFSLVLLVGAGLLVQSFRHLLDVEPGFRTDHALVAEISVNTTKYPETSQRRAIYQQALEKMSAIPGVQAVGVVYPVPLGGNFEAYTFDIVGKPPYTPGHEPVSDRRVISPDYFNAMGIPLRNGRTFNEQDKENAPQVVIINETFARRYFPDQNPVGQGLIPGEGRQVKPREIVGVVGDVRHAGLDAQTSPEYYVPYQQVNIDDLTLVARTTSGNPLSVAGSLRGIVRSLDPEIPFYNVQPLTQLLSESVARRRFNTILLGTFAVLALLLASIGIYGVMNYSVAQRTREIGIRIALGAQVKDVLRLILKQGLALALIGLAAGLLLSLFVTKVMSSLLYGVSRTDPVTFAGVALLLLVVVLLACLLPARRAARVDPNVALRYE